MAATLTHTWQKNDDLIEVREIGRMIDGRSVWLDEKNNHYFNIDAETVVIPSFVVAAEANKAKIDDQRPLVVVEDIYKILREVKNNQALPKIKHLEDGRIVRANGSPWVLRSKAAQALRAHQMTDSHVVDGYGNNGPNGREWWLRPRRKIKSDFTLFENKFNWPLDDEHPLTLEIMDAAPSIELSSLESELTELRKEWGLKYDSSRRLIGFQNERDYSLFLAMYKT